MENKRMELPTTVKSFAGTESVWVFKVGLDSLINNISQIARALKLASYGNSSQGWLLGPFRCSFGCLPNHRVFVLLDALMNMARVTYTIAITWIAFNDVFGKLHIVRWSRIQWVEVFVNLRRLLRVLLAQHFQHLVSLEHVNIPLQMDIVKRISCLKFDRKTETHLANCLNKCKYLLNTIPFNREKTQKAFYCYNSLLFCLFKLQSFRLTINRIFLILRCSLPNCMQL